MNERERTWQHPWRRIERLIRLILETRWDKATWPTAKATLKQARDEGINAGGG